MAGLYDFMKPQMPNPAGVPQVTGARLLPPIPMGPMGAPAMVNQAPILPPGYVPQAPPMPMGSFSGTGTDPNWFKGPSVPPPAPPVPPAMGPVNVPALMNPPNLGIPPAGPIIPNPAPPISLLPKASGTPAKQMPPAMPQRPGFESALARETMDPLEGQLSPASALAQETMDPREGELPSRIPVTEEPARQQEKKSEFGLDAKAMALIQMGLAMMQPVAVGQSPLGHMAAAGMQGLGTYAKGKEGERRAAMDERQEARADRGEARADRGEQRAERGQTASQKNADREYDIAVKREQRLTKEGASQEALAKARQNVEAAKLKIDQQKVNVEAPLREAQANEANARAELYGRSAGRGTGGAQSKLPQTRNEFEAQALLGVLKDPMAAPEDIENVMKNVQQHAGRFYDEAGQLRTAPAAPQASQGQQPSAAPPQQESKGGFPSFINPIKGNVYELGKYTAGQFFGSGEPPKPTAPPKNAPKSAMEAATAFKAANKGKQLSEQEAIEVNRRLKSWYPDYDGTAIRPGPQ